MYRLNHILIVHAYKEHCGDGLLKRLSAFKVRGLGHPDFRLWLTFPFDSVSDVTNECLTRSLHPVICLTF